MPKAINNSLKKALKAGRYTAGSWLHLGSPVIAEVLSIAGFDWLLIDMEHGFGDYQTLLAQLQAIQCGSAIPIVRVQSNDYVMIKRVLDIGVQGIMIPNISSAIECEAAVKACKYPPEGRRGIGPIRAAHYGKFDEYIKYANQEILVLIQIEAAEGVKNIDEILRVPGVDVIFIGPNDLAASLGHIGNLGHADVLAAIERIETAAINAKIALATVSHDTAEAKALRERGYQMLTLCSDATLLTQGATSLISKFRANT